LDKLGYEELESSYDVARDVITSMMEGSTRNLLTDDTTPIIALHAIAYVIWDNPLSFVLLTAVLNSLGIAYFLTRFEVKKKYWPFFIWSPPSLYFAATHFKEAITETIICFMYPSLHGKGRIWIAIVSVILLAAWRPSYLTMIAIIFIYRCAPSLAKLRPSTTLFMILFLFSISPSFYADWMIHQTKAGMIFSLVYLNEFTRRVFGPLIGLVQPFPFLIPVSSIGGAFQTVYGLFYYFIWTKYFTQYKGDPKTDHTWLAHINCALALVLVISYRFTGQSGTKDRYFAPFLVILILGVAKLCEAQPATGNYRENIKPEPAIAA
jgi:hypothetical protein